MKSHKKQILRLLENHGDSLSTKQIRGALGLNKTATAKLKAELLKLIKAGKISKQGTRYFKAQEKPKHAVSKEKRKEAKEAKIEKRSQIKNESIWKPRAKRRPRSGSGKTEKGYFTRNQKGFGFVAIGGGRSDVFIGENEQGYAMEGDLVEIEIFRSRGFHGKRKGEIVNVIERASSEILARLKRTKRETVAVPVHRNSGLPFLWIAEEDDLPELETGTLVEVELLEENKHAKKSSPAPSGRVLRALENTSDHELGFQLILNENLIRTEYPQGSLEHVKKFSPQVRFDSSSGRRDLRDLDFVTIDGKTARDFDDAVCVTSDSGKSGGFRLFVAIADVAHYVRPEDPVDQEALIRGTSVYFPTHAVPMLPEELSNNLCSLRPNVNRLTLTCEMRIDSSGEVIGYSLAESIIRSRARLIYEDVADLLDGRTSSISSPELKTNIRKMHKLAKILERKRIQRGAVQFSFAEEVFEFDSDQQMTGIGRSYQSSAMKLIEQFMLEANETVARHCVKNRIPALYRVHDRPDMRKLQKLQQTFFRFGVKTSLSTLADPKKFNEVIEQIQELPHFEQLQVLLLRSMALAVYQTTNKGHFGLAAEYYAHFTSPIRRYPDLVVHRALKEKLHFDQGVKSKNERPPFVNSEMAEQCSQQERRAEKAERQGIDLMKVDFLAPHAGQTFQAVVTSIDNHGFRVNLEPHGLEWFLPLEAMPDDNYVYDDIRLSLQGRRKNRTLQAGQRLEIRLLRADPIHRTLQFEVERWLS
ncbi:MAG: ribonuclease R [SAR324 cluster bacterium]|jgi:ribonuclease R|nr:ribonuclease R [SAR324 cluster bacterium]MDP6743481.1 ribonuclease R [SAR324 cluster bacterium]